MDWSRGFSASYYATTIDPDTFRDLERFEIVGGSINRTDSGLRESADLDCVRYGYGYEQWIRVYLDVRQGASHGHVALFTGIASSPERNIDGEHEDNPLECYSVLRPARDVLLPTGWFAAKGYEGGEVIRKLLKVCKAPVAIKEGSPRLASHIIAEQGETHLTMIDKILDAIGWRMRISGDGTIYICSKAVEPSVTFSALDNDSVEPAIDVERDLFDCPNAFRATAGSVSAEAIDDDEDSELSTVSRGREVWKEETSCTLYEGETLARYAKRRLKELQSVSTTASYDRRYRPDLIPTDMVALNYPAQGLVGAFTITSQKIKIEYEAKTAEEVTSA